MQRDQRRLAAILAADVAGYSRLMAADERGTLALLRRFRAEVIEPKIIGIRPSSMLCQTLATCCGQLGHADEAKAALVELSRLIPKNANRQWEMPDAYVDPEHRAQFIEGLHKAGWAR